MNVTGILRRSIRSKMGILAYAPGASICAIIPPSTVRNAGTWGLGLGLGDLQIQYSPLPFITLVP